MAEKKKASKPISKKDMKKTKGGSLNFTNTLVPAVQHDISISNTIGQKVSPGTINGCDGSV